MTQTDRNEDAALQDAASNGDSVPMAAGAGDTAAPNANAAPISIDGAASDNVYAQARSRAHRRMPGGQALFAMGVTLVVIYIVALIIPKGIVPTIYYQSSNGYNLSWFIVDLQTNLNGLMAVLTNTDTGPTSYMPYVIRYLMVPLAGAGLALCGAVYQGTFRNALVTPSTLGVMSGAQLGMAVYVIVFVANGFSSTELLMGNQGSTALANVNMFGAIFNSFGYAITSFIGCLLVVGVVLGTMRFISAGSNGIAMIICGQMIAGVVGAVIGIAQYYYMATDPGGTVANALRELMVMSFYRNYGVVDVLIVVIPFVVTLAVMLRLAGRMQLLAFDDAEVRTMGVDVKRMRVVTVALTTLLTAIIVSFCGMVGFVGFLVPHLARRIVGPNFKVLLPASALMGAIFVLTAYMLLAVIVGSGMEQLVGIFISVLGGFVFVGTVLRGGAARGGFR